MTSTAVQCETTDAANSKCVRCNGTLSGPCLARTLFAYIFLAICTIRHASGKCLRACRRFLEPGVSARAMQQTTPYAISRSISENSADQTSGSDMFSFARTFRPGNARSTKKKKKGRRNQQLTKKGLNEAFAYVRRKMKRSE